MMEVDERLKEPEEILEPELSAEEKTLQDIQEAGDGEQVRVHSLTDPGTPQKYIVYKSEKLNKQVLVRTEYHVLKEQKKDEVIGYLRKGDTKTVQDYGIENKLDLHVTGEQERGE